MTNDEMIEYLQDPDTSFSTVWAAWDVATALILDDGNTDTDMIQSVEDELKIHEKSQKLVSMIEKRWRMADDAARSQRSKGLPWGKVTQ